MRVLKRFWDSLRPIGNQWHHQPNRCSCTKSDTHHRHHSYCTGRYNTLDKRWHLHASTIISRYSCLTHHHYKSIVMSTNIKITKRKYLQKIIYENIIEKMFTAFFLQTSITPSIKRQENQHFTFWFNILWQIISHHECLRRYDVFWGCAWRTYMNSSGNQFTVRDCHDTDENGDTISPVLSMIQRKTA